MSPYRESAAPTCVHSWGYVWLSYPYMWEWGCVRCRASAPTRVRLLLGALWVVDAVFLSDFLGKHAAPYSSVPPRDP